MIAPPTGGQAVRGSSVGKRPKNRAGVVVAGCCSCDCFGGTAHREVSALTRIPSLKRDKISIIVSATAIISTVIVSSNVIPTSQHTHRSQGGLTNEVYLLKWGFLTTERSGQSTCFISLCCSKGMDIRLRCQFWWQCAQGTSCVAGAAVMFPPVNWARSTVGSGPLGGDTVGMGFHAHQSALEVQSLPQRGTCQGVLKGCSMGQPPMRHPVWSGFLFLTWRIAVVATGRGLGHTWKRRAKNTKLGPSQVKGTSTRAMELRWNLAGSPQKNPGGHRV